MKIGYLEIVTADVDGVCATYERLHGVTFGAPVAALGHARTTTLAGGGVLGVRAPLREDEAPVVRPYFRVEDVEASAEVLPEAGALVAHPPLELPGHGKFAIYFRGEVQHGLWE